MAVQFYRDERQPNDLDLLVFTSIENSERVARALGRCGVEGIDPKRLQSPKLQIPLKTLHYADVLTVAADQSFARIWDYRNSGRINGVVVPFIALSDLVAMKKSAAAKSKEEFEKHTSDIELLSKVSSNDPRG